MDSSLKAASNKSQGFFKIPNDLVSRGTLTKITGSAFKVLAVLLFHADKDGRCWPSQQRLSELTGLGRTAVVDSLAQLISSGLVVKGKRKRFNQNEYQVSCSLSGQLNDASCSDSGHELFGFRTSSCSDSGLSKRTRIKEQESRTKIRGKPVATCESEVATCESEELTSPIPMSGGLDFESWWKLYPKRQGRRRGKQTAKRLFAKIKVADRPELFVATENYARECGDFAKDPERFLKSNFWRDFVESASAESGVRFSRQEQRNLETSQAWLERHQS